MEKKFVIYLARFWFSNCQDFYLIPKGGKRCNKFKARSGIEREIEDKLSRFRVDFSSHAECLFWLSTLKEVALWSLLCCSARPPALAHFFHIWALVHVCGEMPHRLWLETIVSSLDQMSAVLAFKTFMCLDIQVGTFAMSSIPNPKMCVIVSGITAQRQNTLGGVTMRVKTMATFEVQNKEDSNEVQRFIGRDLYRKCCKWSNVPLYLEYSQWNNWLFPTWLLVPKGAEAPQVVSYPSFCWNWVYFWLIHNVFCSENRNAVSK